MRLTVSLLGILVVVYAQWAHWDRNQLLFTLEKNTTLTS
jgi:hypothetical protein